jgi:hypothetical protein
MKPFVLYRFKVRDPIAGKRRITNYRLTIAAARGRPGCHGERK